MIKTIVSDFSRVILSPQDKSYTGTLSSLRKKLEKERPKFRIVDYYRYNEELLGFFTKLKEDYTMIIFSAGSMLHNDEIKEKLSSVFGHMLSAPELGILKTEADAYLMIAKKFNNRPEEMLFIDDASENIEAAKKAGLKTIHFLYTDQCVGEMKRILANTKKP